MALLTGLPMPRLTSPQDAAAEQSGSGMSNFLRLMQIIQGAPGEKAQTEALQQKTKIQQQEHDNMMKGLDVVREKFSGVSSPEDALTVLEKNPQLMVDPYTQKWIQSGLSMQQEMQKIKEGSQKAKLDLAAAQFEQKQNEEFVQAVPGRYSELRDTLDSNGRWTPNTADIFDKYSDKIDEWKKKEALLKPGVIAAETRGQYSIARQEMADEARKDLQSLKLSADSSAIHSKGLTFANHLQLNQFKLEADLIKQLPLKKQDKAKMEFDNRWKQIWQQAEQDSNQTAPSVTTPTSKGVQLKDKKTGQLFNYNGDAADVPTDRYDILSQ